MKKLLILVLVLGMASVASAAPDVDFYIGGSEVSVINLLVDQTVTLQLYANNADAYTMGIGGSDVSGNMYTSAATIAGFTGVYAYDTTKAGGDAYMSFYNSGPDYSYFYLSASDSTSPFTLTSGVQFTMALKGLAEGTTYITMDISSPGTDQTIQVNVIPEPMTIALLGLGGLFLRRRK
jgi:hypothetical protein